MTLMQNLLGTHFGDDTFRGTTHFGGNFGKFRGQIAQPHPKCCQSPVTDVCTDRLIQSVTSLSD
jgi:hypothetical protein